MKANEAPEKIYVQLPSRKWIGWTWNETPIKEGDNPNWKNATNIEYTRTDAFIEKALKWYCLDCECNDNCKDTKCFFHNAYKRYLEGDTSSLPPKFSNTILNEDGSTSDNWRYRHFTRKIQDALIEKACSWLENNLQGVVGGSIYIEDFRKYMEGGKEYDKRRSII